MRDGMLQRRKKKGKKEATNNVGRTMLLCSTSDLKIGICGNLSWVVIHIHVYGNIVTEYQIQYLPYINFCAIKF